MTATTVGYGDQFPVTTGGRIAGLVFDRQEETTAPLRAKLERLEASG